MNNNNIQTEEALRRCEEAARIEEKRLNSVIKLSQQKTSSLKELLDSSLNEAIALSNSRLGYIYFYDEESKEFALHAWSSEAMKECKINEPATIFKLDKTGIWGEVVRQRSAILINDFQAYNPLKKGYPPGHAPLFRFMTLPVITDERIDAVIGVANKDQDYTDADARQLNLMMVSVWKIAERFKVEETLKKSEEKFSKVFQSSPAAMLITRLSDRHIIELNKAFVKLSGFSQQEVIGQRALDLGIYADLRDREHIIKTTAVEGKLNNYDFRFNAKGNKRLVCRISTELIQLEEPCMLSTITDLTENKHVEEALRESEVKIKALNEELEQRVTMRTAELEQANRDLLLHSKKLEESTRRLEMLSQAIDSSPISVVMTNRYKNIVYVNSHVADVTGYSIDELLGQNPRIFKSGQHADEYYINMWATLDNGTQWSGEICNKKKSGELFWESSSISPVFDATGKVTNYIAVKEDITQQRRMIQQMEMSKSAAEAANQAKTTFLANMSHEIRTPMNAILGYTQLMQRSLSLNADQRDYIKIINQSGEHLLTLINDILEMSKIESGRVVLNLEDFSLTDLLDDCARMFMVLILQKDLLLKVNIQSSIARYICTDGKKVRQVLINIIGNAIKFTEKGGIDIRVLSTNSRKEDQLFLIIEVEDTGCGIAPEEIGKVFEAFEQTQSGKRQGSSTGLGMPISRYYARLMGGDLTVTSRLGEGSKFRFTLTVQNSSFETLDKKTSRQRAVIGLKSGKSSPKIMVVDDIITNRTLLRRLLEEVGFTVLEAGDGREALSLIKYWKPEVILMDARMPEMDGFKATRILKSTLEGKHIRVIMITASALENDRQEALYSGADGFIRKPFKVNEILGELQRILGVDYIYEDASGERSDAKALEESHRLVAQVPPQVVTSIVEAVELGESIVLKELINLEVMRHSPILGQKLRELANNYDYRGIKEILRRGSLK
ncbi:PAS domain S-box protein [Desulfosporosinus sp. Sb-LF]|uniref:PAS domain S-box protein n=1 Tax=Desulfosporosinus sp. Sb-LF TaxID=2560027 RepID=UPI00107FB902|nr:PAS domain S-box protein [Desulfosporosinus sp. Sb-LF]TGE32061.1 PAS domain S-box protein [Desulfosporosinus sp. Sb-LF]